MNNVLLNILSHVLWYIWTYISSGFLRRAELLSHGVCMSLHFLGNVKTAFQSDCANLHAHQHCIKVYLPSWPTLAFVKLIFVYLVDVWLYLIVSLLWYSMIPNEIGQFSFGYPSGFPILWILFMSFIHFFNELSLLIFRISLFTVDVWTRLGLGTPTPSHPAQLKFLT